MSSFQGPREKSQIGPRKKNIVIRSRDIRNEIKKPLESFYALKSS